MDQQTYCNSTLHNPVDSHDIPDNLFSSNSANTSYENLATQGSTSLSIWHSDDPSSSGHLVNHCDYDGTKREHMWSSSLTTDAGGPVIEESHFQSSSTLSLGRVNINLNSNHVVDAEPFLQNPTSSDVPQGSDLNGGEDIDMMSPPSETEPRSPPSSTVLCQSAYLPSSSRISSPSGSSSGCAGLILDDSDSRSDGSLDVRRLSCKRKNIEGGNAGSSYHNENSSLHSVSAPHNATTTINMSDSSSEAAGSNHSEAQLTERSGAGIRGTTSERYPPFVGRVENSERNFRMRTHLHDTYPPNVSAPRYSNVRSSHQSSSHPIPFNHSLDSRPAFSGSRSQLQHQLPIRMRLARNVHSSQWYGDANSRVGSLPSSDDSGERLTSSGVHSGSIPGNSVLVDSLFVSPSDIRPMGQDPTHWRLGNANSSLPRNIFPTSRACTSSRAHSSVGQTWAPQHNLHAQQPLAEEVHRSVSASSASGDQNINDPPAHPSGHSVASQETGHHSGAGFSGNPQSLLRSIFLPDRQNDGLPGVPLSTRNLTAVRESRYRMLSEIRNALDLMRRGENLRFEDIFVLDHSAFFGGADLHDRHRDMRLDVDNMSYEELLALEERIGYVNTGVSEEKISKCLKQRVYLPVATEPPNETEPCCVCQEEYVEGENLGTIQCGHDFHADCIKQWLMLKNLCPICKTTGLVT
ncbi:hypothetical protein J5N97_002203 [Dioscorea zingiberensis]|uniref:RING-type E3 ubiquitin transferase n=1 Tax=Dioscorea zingiberensis TaxID=325984 RepID=A0A9D5D3W0_9LILI|nr:hypothetical protein J5N97_002203 [Dioscorea zingiberensis]